MNTSESISRMRGWRKLLVLIAVLGALGGVSTPGALAATSPDVYTSTSHAVQRALAAMPADDPLPAPAEVSAGRFQYFSQTAHFLRGVFLTYWQTHGATPVMGLPITEALTEDGLTVQYLERVRLEWHPEISKDSRNQVLLTRLGVISTEARGLTFDRLPAGDSGPNSAFFAETGHNLANAFLSYWQRNGGLAVFGYPISEEIVETSPTNGKQYSVQYFERNRFEWHPELGPSFNVQLGLLGVEYARMVGLNPLSRVLLPAPVPSADRDLSDSAALSDLVDSDLLAPLKALGHTPQFRWVPAVLIQNNVFVEFSNLNEDGVAGAFIATRSRTRPYVIVVPESERGASLESLGSVLAHEATHAYDLTSGVQSARSGCSVEEELRAYMNGLAAWVLLKGDNALSQRYAAESLDAAVNRSVRGFNADNTQLGLDFSPQIGREYLRELYGASCGK